MLNAAHTHTDALPGTDGPQPARRLGADVIARSLSKGTPRTLATKEHIFREGEPATHVYRVEAGHVCLYRVWSNGGRQVFAFAYPGDLIGLGELGEHATSAQATGPTRLTSFAIANVREIARRDLSFGLAVWEALAQELIAARDQLISVSQRTAYERLAAFLLALSRRNRRRVGVDYLVLPMTRTDIADSLGLTVETVSRTFTKLRVDGLIDVERSILVRICDHDALERAASGDVVRR